MTPSTFFEGKVKLSEKFQKKTLYDNCFGTHWKPVLCNDGDLHVSEGCFFDLNYKRVVPRVG